MVERIHISELTPGAEVLCWMRLGLALTVVRRGNGTLYRQVPAKPQKAGPGDLSRFSGWVTLNQPDQQVISLHVTANSSRASVGYNRAPALLADISYSSFTRVRKYSEIHVEANQENTTFPANFPDAAYKPFRTLVDVKLV